MSEMSTYLEFTLSAHKQLSRELAEIRTELNMANDFLTGQLDQSQKLRKNITLLMVALQNNTTEEEFDQEVSAINHAMDHGLPDLWTTIKQGEK
tara:strand:+ start:348 stop:629 length:282 start_codon:yes stop_codon:yes gene_type:complete